MGIKHFALEEFNLTRRGNQSICFPELYNVILKLFPKLKNIKFFETQHLSYFRSRNFKLEPHHLNCSLISIDLQGCKFNEGNRIWQSIFSVIFQIPSIEIINLKQTNFGVKFVSEFEAEFEKITEHIGLYSLQEINLSETDFSDSSS